ncbi:MAG: hypothetical protein COB83_09075 [Gammaproteobacteria bacterium]|nr:MAG: hypothetical protein COB83_09075 [Gammaproteobacteria bacterium]
MNIFELAKQKLKKFISKRVNLFLSRRVPSNYQHKLSSRNIFIIPTRFGFAYLLFDILLFLLGTNYQNNIILMLSYLLASLFISVMLHSFYNLSQLILSSPVKQFTFDKQLAHFPINIKVSKTHFDLNFQLAEQVDFSKKVKLDQCNLGENKILLPVLPVSRGVHNLGRIKVFSEYSLGLFITWAMLDFSHQLVVFPQPKKLNLNQNYLAEFDDFEQQSNVSRHITSGVDDFAELKNYVIGESQARIAWKQLARGQGKLSKHYQNQQGNLIWLKLSAMPSAQLETKLSFLCFLILEYSKSEHCFGLVLDVVLSTGKDVANNSQPVKIAPNSGYQHQQNCLIALAELKHSDVS